MNATRLATVHLSPRLEDFDEGAFSRDTARLIA